MQYEVFNDTPRINRWQSVKPSLYKFLTEVRKYQGRVVKPAIATTEPAEEVEADDD